FIYSFLSCVMLQFGELLGHIFLLVRTVAETAEQEERQGIVLIHDIPDCQSGAVVTAERDIFRYRSRCFRDEAVTVTDFKTVKVEVFKIEKWKVSCNNQVIKSYFVIINC